LLRKGNIVTDALKFESPDTVLPPYGAYSHAAVAPASSRFIFTAGQVGETRAGEIPATVEGQYEVALRNILNIISAQGASSAHIVKLTTYLVAPIAPDRMGAIRHSVFGDIKPAATLLFVPKLAGPDYLVEVEAIAVAPGK
jgi:enamine deaminase RidA (YjgF/YER057c/UK114 family)